MSSSLRGLSLVALLALTPAACGKKGAPLPPIVRVPAAVDKVDARRIGNDIYLTLTIPTQNIDKTTPSDVSRVDVYALTGLESPGARLLSGATLVASIPVAVVPRGPGGAPLPPTPRPGEVLQGAVVTVRDTLTAATLQPQPLPPLPVRRGAPVLPALAPPVGPPRRYYVAIGFSDRGRSGPQGTPINVSLGPLPEPPTGLTAEYPPESIRLRWEPSGGLMGFLLDRPLPAEIPPVDVPTAAPATAAVPPPAPAGAAAQADLPPPPTRYNVFREIASDPLVLPDGPPPAAWQAEVPVPLNAAPLDVLTLEDPLLYDGRERCYYVRAVRGTGATAIQSPATSRICVTPVDVTGPVTPTGLEAEVSDGAITLLWDPNVDEDLAGYLVLRGVPGDATLSQLTPRPVGSARYVDRAVTPGTRYVYAVVAVDDRVPLGNVSAESNRVEDTAR